MDWSDMEANVDLAISRVRLLASSWEGVLAHSAWQQAVGSLIEAIASKVIADILELTSIGQDDAYNSANLISRITELDDLFLPSRQPGKAHGAPQQGQDNDVPTTAQYTPSWLRLKYLLEVLQSNLQDVKFLWFESELSLYFSADEVVDLINMSFESNPRTREVIREIKQRANPRA